MTDAHIIDADRECDRQCEAQDIMNEIIDQRVEDMLEDGDIALISDAFDDSHEITELYLAHRGDLLNLAEVLDRRVKAYLREIAEQEYE